MISLKHFSVPTNADYPQHEFIGYPQAALCAVSASGKACCSVLSTPGQRVAVV